MWDAMLIAGTPTYANLVRNCARARDAEINWPHQFDKVRASLAAVLGGRGEGPSPTPAGSSPILQRTRGRLADRRRSLQAANGGARCRGTGDGFAAGAAKYRRVGAPDRGRLAALESALAGAYPKRHPRMARTALV